MTHTRTAMPKGVILYDRNSHGQEAGPGQRCPVPRGHVPPAPGLNRDVRAANGHGGWWGACGETPPESQSSKGLVLPQEILKIFVSAIT